MRRLRDATLDEVWPAPPAGYPRCELWLLEGADDLGLIWMQLETRRLGPISELGPRFVDWVEGVESSPEERTCSAEERAKYLRYCDDIETGNFVRWPKPVVLGPNGQIHDGRHRLVAAYSRASAGKPVNIEIFWCHPH